MNNKERVFRIDQECFIIYAEDMSFKKERFLRIGNSMALRRFGSGLTFLSLITPLFPGDAFKEPEIFSPNVDKRIIGLQNVLDRFVAFLQAEGVDTDHVILTPADGMGQPSDRRLSEKQFIRRMNDRHPNTKHSYAAFYEDGNIRIFDHNECMFDLNESLAKTLDEPKETDLLTAKNEASYRSSYAKNGMIYSGRSLFVFSRGEFACLSDNTEWVTDAVRVGIDPGRISFLYIVPSVKPDSLWLKTFIRRMSRDDGSRMRIVIKGQSPNWLKLVSDEIFMPLYPDRESAEIWVGDIRLFFQNQRINIYYGAMRFMLQARHGFLSPGETIGGEYITHNGKKPLSFALGAADAEQCILSDNPVIFGSAGEDEAASGDGQHILAEQHLCIDKSSSLTVQNVLLRSRLSPVPESLDPFLFFAKEYDIVQIQSKYEEFCSALGRDWTLSQADCDRYKARYEQLIRDKQFCLDEQQRLLDFIAELDDEEQQTLRNSQEERFNESLNSGMQSRSVNDSTEIAPQSEISADESSYDGDIHGSDAVSVQDEDSYNAEELLKDGSFDEYADQVKPMNVGRKYQYNGRDGLTENSSDDDNGDRCCRKTKIVWRMRGILLLLLLILLGLLGYLFAACIIPHYRRTVTPQQTDERYADNDTEDIMSLEEAFLAGITGSNDEQELQYGSCNPGNGMRTRSVKTSFCYKFRMTVTDKVELTNAIAVNNDYQKMDREHKRKYDSDDPHWIYPGNILTMPDGSNVTVAGGDTMWSLCEDYLIKEINGYELEVRNYIEATKNGEMSASDAKIRFAQIRSETHSQMMRDFMDALLAQSDYHGWQTDIKLNGE